MDSYFTDLLYHTLYIDCTFSFYTLTSKLFISALTMLCVDCRVNYIFYRLLGMVMVILIRQGNNECKVDFHYDQFVIQLLSLLFPDWVLMKQVV